MGRLSTLIGLVILVAGATPSAADHQVGHEPPPGPAKVAFAEGFPQLVDSEWGFSLGGFGGIEQDAPLGHAPVIFVHGNNVDHADWYPVRDDFRQAGWTDQELWALSYNGLGANNGTAPGRPNPERDAEHREMDGDGIGRVTANDVNVPDLAAFIEAVQDYTGSRRFSLVSHSLGVTVARKTLFVRPDLAADLVAFVGIAGGNHGTSLCPSGSEGVLYGCDEIARESPWLAELNGPNGELETYGDAAWLTVYDGTGLGDAGYVGPGYAQSPALLGAENREFPGTDHNDLRLLPRIVTAYREFIEDAESALAELPAQSGGGDVPILSGPAHGESGELPASGAGATIAMLLCAVVARRRR